MFANVSEPTDDKFPEIPLVFWYTGKSLSIANDEKLTKLLSPPDGEQVTFLNMQRYINPHYVKVHDDPVTDAAEAIAELSGDVNEVVETAKKVTKRPTVKKAKA